MRNVRTNGNRIKKSTADKGFYTLNAILLGLVTLITVYPLYYTVIASFTDPTVVNTGKLLLFPEKLFFGGYEEIFNYRLIWTSYLNSIVYTLSGTLISIVLTVPLAYALSRKDFLPKKPLNMAFMFTMFFQGGMIPTYITLMKMGMLNTIWSLILPGAVSVWNMVVCRSFFESSIPDELLDAAQIDGCSDFRFFFSIVLPLSSTIVCVMLLFYGTGLWNSYMPALMYLKDTDQMPLQVILRNLLIINENITSFAGVSSAAYRQQLADQLKYCVIVAAALPLLMIYPFLQKYFVRGVMIGAVKG